jgi:hypothetical protein
MKGRYEVVVMKSGKRFKRERFCDYDKAMEACDHFERQFWQDEYTIEFKDRDPFADQVMNAQYA